MSNDWLYGRRPVRECFLAGRRKIKKLCVQTKIKDPDLDNLISSCKKNGIPFFERHRKELDQIVPGALHQGVLAQVEEYPYVAFDEAMVRMKDARSGIWLALDEVQDPQNLGSLIRSAVCVGVQGIFIMKHRACAVTPAVCKASSGTAEHAKVTLLTNLSQSIERFKEEGIWTYGLDVAGEASLPACDFHSKILLVLGAEGKGLRQLTRKKCDFLLKIPQGTTESNFNVGVAGGIALYQAFVSLLKQGK